MRHKLLLIVLAISAVAVPADVFAQPAGGGCGSGLEACGSGCCNIGACISGCCPSPEVCDGQDNDCDGTPDDGLQNQPVTCGAGACETTTLRSCNLGIWDNVCVPSNNSTTEVCNNFDDDCDGVVDNLTVNCQCNGGSPGPEVCDGIDNDCDEGIDEEPTSEVCDGIDNDCDSVVDNGVANCQCNGGSPSTEICDGTDNDCNGQIDENAVTEVCDGEDNDCDTDVDEGFDQDGDGLKSGAPSCTDDPDDTSFLCTSDLSDRDNDGILDCREQCPEAICTAANVCDQARTATINLKSLPYAVVNLNALTIHYGYASCASPTYTTSAGESCVVPPKAYIVAGDPGNYWADVVFSTSGTEEVRCRYTANAAHDPSTVEEWAYEFSWCEDGSSPGELVSCTGVEFTLGDGFPEAGYTQAEVFVPVPDGPCTENLDSDGDGHFPPGSCGYPDDDCDDTDPNNWDSAGCANCNDADGDLFWSGCDTYVSISGPDCDDTDSSIHPGKEDTCDGVDNNCDGITDNPIDHDGDTYDAGCGATTADCNDLNPLIYPSAPELCDQIDNDCNTLVDDGLPQDDSDGDGKHSTVSCVSGAFGDDCNDQDPNVWSKCGTCRNLDGDDDYFDCDAYVTVQGPDCNDGNPLVGSSQPERCDGIDNDCDGFEDEGYVSDQDGDGIFAIGGCSSLGTDCNDFDPDIPGTGGSCDNTFYKPNFMGNLAAGNTLVASTTLQRAQIACFSFQLQEQAEVSIRTHGNSIGQCDLNTTLSLHEDCARTISKPLALGKNGGIGHCSRVDAELPQGAYKACFGDTRSDPLPTGISKAVNLEVVARNTPAIAPNDLCSSSEDLDLSPSHSGGAVCGDFGGAGNEPVGYGCSILAGEEKCTYGVGPGFASSLAAAVMGNRSCSAGIRAAGRDVYYEFELDAGQSFSFSLQTPDDISGWTAAVFDTSCDWTTCQGVASPVPQDSTEFTGTYYYDSGPTKAFVLALDNIEPISTPYGLQWRKQLGPDPDPSTGHGVTSCF